VKLILSSPDADMPYKLTQPQAKILKANTMDFWEGGTGPYSGAPNDGRPWTNGQCPENCDAGVSRGTSWTGGTNGLIVTERIISGFTRGHNRGARLVKSIE
jgi:formylglycine-generating enzyme required for sulfatase activity